MRKLTLAVAVVAAFAANFSYAEDKKPDNEFTYNAALTSDYRFRGISQSRLQPAISVGADFVNNPTGFYVGTWISSIKWITDTVTPTGKGNGNVEIDIYGGKRGEIVKDVSYDVGILTYIYPSNRLSPSAATTEIYGQVGYGPATVKYSHAVTNAFANPNSKNSGYLEVAANIDIAEGTQLNLHAGHQRIRNAQISGISYTDYKVGVTKDFGVASLSGAIIGTDSNAKAYGSPSGKNLGRTALVVTVSKTF